MRRSHETWLKILGCAFVVVAVMCVVFALILANVTGEDGADGADGADGITITDVQKTTEGNVDTYTVYYSDDTTYSFTVTNAGKGDEGVGISTISKTSTSGTVDTYTIYLTDGSEYTFDVTNGNDGDNGDDGDDGDDGDNGTGIKSIDIDDNYTDTSGAYGTANATGTLITITLDDATPTTYSFFVPDGEKGETGDKGDTGLGIKSIVKTETSTNGLTDTYTITYTDDSSSTYTVTNGNYITGVDVTDNKTSSTYTYKFTMKDGTTVEDTVTYTPYITSIAKNASDATALDITYSNGTYATISGVVNINAVKTLTYSNGVLTVTNTDENSYELKLHCVSHTFVKISTLDDEAKEELLGTDNKDLTDIAATCNSTGVTYYYCTVCGEIHSEITEATGHKYDSSTIVQLEVTGSTALYGLKCTTCETYSVVELGFKYTAYDENGNEITETVSGASAQVNTSGSSSASLAGARLTSGNTEIAYYGVSRGNYVGANPVIPSTYNGKPVKQIDNFSDEDYTSTTVTIGSQEITLSYQPLESITIPNSVVYINTFVYDTDAKEYKEDNEKRNYAFKDCTSLTTVNFTGTSSLAYIGTQAFSGCTSLTSFTLPASVEFTGSKVFLNCIKLSSVTFEDGGTAELIIGENVFNGCTSLTSLEIPDRTVTIKNGALAGTSLTSLTLPYIGRQPNTMTDNDNKGYNTFYYIFGDSASDVPTTLTTITITGNSSSSTNSHTIDASAFANCTSLTTVIIEDEITSIGAGAFSGCTSLESITLPFVGDSASNTSSKAKASALFGYIFGTDDYTGGTAVDQYYTNTESESGESESGAEYATYYIPSNLTTVTITGGSGSSGIPRGAFYNCTMLEEVTVGLNVENMGNYAFYNCTSLATVNLESTSMTQIGNRDFYNCTSLTSIEIPESVTYINSRAFYQCSMLESVTINGNLTNIESGNFEDCTTLTTFIAKGNLGNIANSVFRNCTALTTFSVAGDITYIGSYAFYNCSALTNLTITGDITYIGSYAFYNVSGLTTIPLGKVTQIGGYAFYGSGFNLTDLQLDSIRIIDANAFQDCTSIKTITFNSDKDTLISIGANAFRGCTSLTSIDIPDSVTTINNRAFYGCTSLTSVTIGEGVTNLYYYAFYGCTALTEINYNAVNASLTAGEDSNGSSYYYIFYNAGTAGDGITVNIGSKVTQIPANMFDSNDAVKTKITSVVFKENSVCKSIGNNAFWKCTYLTSIDWNGITSLTTIGASAFKCCSITNLTIPDSVTSLGNRAFEDSSIETLVIGDGITSLSGNQFSDCNNLKSLTLGAKITGTSASWFYSAFINCDKIESIEVDNDNTNYKSIDGNLYDNDGTTLIKYATGKTEESFTVPDGVETIYNYAFNYATSLTSVTISDDVETISAYAFRYCSSLKSIVIGNSVAKINDSAFINCSALDTVYYKGTKTEWTTLSSSIGTNNTYLTGATGYYYSATQEAGCWYYDGNGDIAIWS